MAEPLSSEAVVQPYSELMPRLLFWSLAAPLLASFSLCAQATGAGPAEATPQRPSFSGDAATTAPGTVEIEFGAAASGAFFGLPTAVKLTPDTTNRVLRHTEFSVAFDSVTSVSSNGSRTTRFGDRIGFAIRRCLYSSESFAFAIAPQSVFFLRDEQGARLGGAAIATYQFGLNGLVANFVWSAATKPSETNPSRVYDVIAGYGRTLGQDGPLSRLSVFAECLQEFASETPNATSLIQGVSYRVRPNVVLDFAVQQSGLAAGPLDIQFHGGLTVNLGRIRNW